MKAHLIQIDATNTSGVAVSLFVSSVDDPTCCHLNGQQWVPAIARLPELRYDFFGGSFNGQVASPTASFSVSIDGLVGFAGLRFARARVRLWTGELGAAWGGYSLRFDGRVSAEPQVSDGTAQFECGPDDAWLDKPLLALYAGTGGAEGPDDLEGQVKPLVMGNCRFVPGVQVDAVDNVWQVSGYGAVQAVNKTYDRVVALGGPVADYPNYAALIAAAIPNGSTATCRALGLIRLGAPPDGQMSFDISGDAAGAGGYVRRPGALIRRIAEIAGGTVNVANLAALDTARPYNLSLVLTEQTTARDVIQQIADSVCAVAGISWTGTLFVQPLGYTAPTLTLASDGTALPPVEDVEVQPVAAPFWRLATDAEISWVTHSTDQVASEYVLRGPYNAARVYRLDDMVSLEDGSAWVYINAAPSSGNAPPMWPTHSNAWWVNVGTPASVTWENVADPSGTKPEDNATKGATPAQEAAIYAPRIELSNPASTTWAYENGVVASYATLEGLLHVIAGSASVTAASTLSVVAAGCTGTINTAENTPVAGKPKGYYRITAIPAGTDNSSLTFTAAYGGFTRTAVFTVDKIRAGFQIVTSLPTTNLFPDRKVSYQEKLWVYKGAPINSWRPLIDVDSALDGAMLDPKTVTASKMLITPDNLVLDPEYYDVNGYWSPNTSIATFSVNRAQASGHYGQASVLLARNVSPSATSAWTRLFATQPVSVQEGAEFFSSIGWWHNRTCRVLIRVTWYSDLEGIVYLNALSLRAGDETGSGNKFHSSSGPVPTGARSMRAEMFIDRSFVTDGLVSDFNIGRFLIKEKNAGKLIVDGDILARHLSANSVIADKIEAGAVIAGKIAANAINAININVRQINADKIMLSGVDLANMNYSQFSQEGTAYSGPTTHVPNGGSAMSPASVGMTVQGGGFFSIDLITMTAGMVSTSATSMILRLWNATDGIIMSDREISEMSISAQYRVQIRQRNLYSTPKTIFAQLHGVGHSASASMYDTTLSLGWGAFG